MQSQIELDSFASMIVTNLPFPPLPVCAGRGEECVESMCSSHDLLSRAVSCNLMSGLSDGEAIQVRKQNILLALNTQVTDVWKARRVPEAERIQRCYEIYSDALRQYMALYPGSPDLRVLPMDTVDKSSIIFQQALDHLKAQSIYITDDDSVACVQRHFHSYPQLLKGYIQNMWNDRRERMDFG